MSRASNGSRRTSSSSPEYLFQSKDGVWIFQIYVPKYMRHLFQNKRAYRKSTGTSDLALARQFRNHMLIEFNNIKTLLNPDQPHVRIQNAIAALPVVRQAPPAVHTPNHTTRTPEPRTDRYSEPETHQSKPEPTLSSILTEYTAQYSTRRAPSTLSKSARAVHVFLSTTKHTDIKICDVTRSLVHRLPNIPADSLYQSPLDRTQQCNAMQCNPTRFSSTCQNPTQLVMICAFHDGKKSSFGVCPALPPTARGKGRLELSREGQP